MSEVIGSTQMTIAMAVKISKEALAVNLDDHNSMKSMGRIVPLREPPSCSYTLRHENIIGRSNRCDLTIPTTSVSTAHALVRWGGDHWLIRDLGSRNGTFVCTQSGQAVSMLSPGQEKVLTEHDILWFAEDSEKWQLLDASQPLPTIVGVETNEQIVLDREILTAIPSEEKPLATICWDKEDHSWRLEYAGGLSQNLQDREQFILDSVSYQFNEVPEQYTREVSRAPRPANIDNIRMVVWDSGSKETSIEVTSDAGSSCSESASHLSLIAYLARHRLEDLDGGWITTDQATDDLSLSSIETLNIYVYRCRKTLEALKVSKSVRLIDRTRRGSLRLGIDSKRLLIKTMT